MVETTKTKYIEATQFTKEEFVHHADVGAPPITNEFKKGAFVKLAELLKDPKSELNSQMGGMKNVRRVRVLRDANIKDDTASNPGKLVLVFDLLSAAKNVRIDQPVVPKQTVNRTFHLFLEVLSRVDQFCELISKQAMLGGYPEEFQTSLTKVRMLIAVDQSQINFLQARSFLQVLMLQAPKETEDHLKLWNMLDYLQSLMVICSIEGAIGPARFAELAHLVAPTSNKKGVYVKDQRPSHRNGNGKGPNKPKSSPVVQTKPQPPSQN